MTDRFPRQPQLAALSRKSDGLGGGLLSPSAESMRLYRYCGIPSPVDGVGPLSEGNVRPFARFRLQNVFGAHMKWMGRERFVNKHTPNTLRLRYLYEVFRNARFIHIIRNGCAVAASLRKVGWWENLHLWWCGCTPRQLAKRGVAPLAVAAMHWKNQVDEALRQKSFLPASRYTECRYERLLRDPERVLKRLLAFCGLNWQPRLARAIGRAAIQPERAERWRHQLDAPQRGDIFRAAGDRLVQLGYA